MTIDISVITTPHTYSSESRRDIQLTVPPMTLSLKSKKKCQGINYYFCIPQLQFHSVSSHDPPFPAESINVLHLYHVILPLELLPPQHQYHVVEAVVYATPLAI